MASERLQLRFHGGRQQRYFADRTELLECVLRVASQSDDAVFEVWTEDEPFVLSDGRPGGRRFELKEVLDLSQEGTRAGILKELGDA